MNAKMKVLSLALVGLGGLGFAGAALAACPSTPVPPWSSQSALNGSLTITSPGLEPTPSECHLNASLTTDGAGSTAFVRDDSPSAEPRYRARFYVDTTAVGSLSGLASTQIFTANTDAASSNISYDVRLTVFGSTDGSSKVLGIFTPCTDSAHPDSTCSATFPLTANSNSIEIDWQSGAAGVGYLKVWVNNATEASPDVNIAANNEAWGGIDFAALGLSNASSDFRTNHVNQVVAFDAFDSRRSTFIGQ